MNIHARIAEAARETDRSPTPAQAEAGNYRKGRVVLNGLPPIRIESPRGSIRRGVGANGKPWSCKLPAHYGYFERTNGADGDEVDVYLGPFKNALDVFVVDQVDADGGKFDEHKVMLGFASRAEAIECFVDAFSDGKGVDRLGKITTLTLDGLKERLKRRGGFIKQTKRASGGRVGYQEGGDVEPAPEPGQQQDEARVQRLDQLAGRERPYIEITPHDRPAERPSNEPLASGEGDIKGTIKRAVKEGLMPFGLGALATKPEHDPYEGKSTE